MLHHPLPLAGIYATITVQWGDMPEPVQIIRKHHIQRHRNFGVLYVAVTLLSLHWALVLYINSSFLEQYVPNTTLGTLYTIGSALTILSFLFISRVLRRAGNYRLTLLLTALEFTSLIGMSLSESLRSAVPFFLLHQTVMPLILFNLDVFMEEFIGKHEQTTGGKRGLFLAIMSFAGAIAPLAAGYLLGDNEPNYALAYLTSALILLPFIAIMMYYFRSFSDPEYRVIKILPTIRSFWIRPDIKNVFLCHFLLQFFFAWTVIYMPLYLISEIGLSWEETGLIIFTAIMAYVFLEYPIGLIADRYIGEKEMMAAGFAIMAVSSSWLAFITSTEVLPWMIAMFMTRVGASLVETTTESYFFKHTDGSDTNIISFFRITRPLSYVIGALVGSFALLYLPFNLIFVVLGLALVPGLFFTMLLRDTK
jgi:MFS family permease